MNDYRIKRAIDVLKSDFTEVPFIPEKEIIDLLQELAWLQSQVIVLEEGAKIQAGDVIQEKNGNNFYWVRTQEIADIENAEYLRERWNAEIIRRICPTEGKLKAVVYKKGAV